MNTKLYYLLPVIGLLLLSACSNDDPTTQEQMLGTWKFNGTTITTVTPDTTTAEMLLGLPCNMDNTLIFNIGDTYEQNEGNTKCNEDDPQTIATGTWALLSDDTQLQLTTDGESTLSTITELDGSNLTLLTVEASTDSSGTTIETRVEASYSR